MSILADTKDTGFWVAKLVAITIICALMYKGMAIFSQDTFRSDVGTGKHQFYMNSKLTK